MADEKGRYSRMAGWVWPRRPSDSLETSVPMGILFLTNGRIRTSTWSKMKLERIYPCAMAGRHDSCGLSWSIIPRGP